MSKPDQEMMLSVEEKEFVHQSHRAGVPHDNIEHMIHIIQIARSRGVSPEEVKREHTILKVACLQVIKQFPSKPWTEVGAQSKSHEN